MKRKGTKQLHPTVSYNSLDNVITNHDHDLRKSFVQVANDQQFEMIKKQFDAYYGTNFDELENLN